MILRSICLILLLLFSCVGRGNKNTFPGVIKLRTGRHHTYATVPSFTTQMGWEQGKPYIRNVSHKVSPSQQYSDTIRYEFYASPFDSKPTKTLRFFIDFEYPIIRETTMEKDFSWFDPLEFNPQDTLSGHYSISLTCKSKLDDWYEVVIDENTQSTFWILRSRNFTLQSWKKYLKDKSLLISPTDCQLYTERNTSSPTKRWESATKYLVVKVKRKWLQIQPYYGDLCEEEECCVKERLWIPFNTSSGVFINGVKINHAYE